MVVMRIILKASLRIANLRFELTTFLVNHAHIQKQWFLQAEKIPKKNQSALFKKKSTEEWNWKMQLDPANIIVKPLSYYRGES